jgi:hypothetical protein
MCAAALSFCGVGTVRYLAADPSFVATADPRGGTQIDPTAAQPELTMWAILANALFLQPAIAHHDAARLARNRQVEPETIAAATRVAAVRQSDPQGGLDALVAAMRAELVVLAEARRRRLGWPT